MRKKSERSHPPPKTARSRLTAIEKAKTNGRQALASEFAAVSSPATTEMPQSVRGSLKQDTVVRFPRAEADAALLEAKNNLDAIFNAITEAVFLFLLVEAADTHGGRDISVTLFPSPRKHGLI
jgi:hypothetical protein